MGSGGFVQRYVVDPLRGLEGRVVAGSRNWEQEARQAGIARNDAMFDNSTVRDQLIDEIRGMNKRGIHVSGREPRRMSDQAMANLETRLAAGQALSPASRQYLAENMPRGPMGKQRSIGEVVHGTMADNALVRRSVLGGGAVLGGVGMTAGAQQLMALMQYLQAGQTTEAEAGQPLTS